MAQFKFKVVYAEQYQEERAMLFTCSPAKATSMTSFPSHAIRALGFDVRSGGRYILHISGKKFKGALSSKYIGGAGYSIVKIYQNSFLFPCERYLTRFMGKRLNEGASVYFTVTNLDGSQL